MKQIISKYQNEFGIVTNINYLIKDLEKMYTKKQIIAILKEIIANNQRIYDTLEKELSKSFNDTKYQAQNSIVYEPTIPPISNQKDLSGISINVEKYLKNLNSTSTEEEIISILPQKSANNFDNILFAIKCQILEDIALYEQELLNNPTKEEAEIYQVELQMLRYKLEVINNYHTKLDIEESAIADKNKLLFLHDNDTNLIIKDLNDIDPSEYQDFYSLLNSIIKGTFTGNKSVFLNKSNKIPEIRKVNGERIIFDHTLDNYYTILFIFNKNNTFIYRSRLVERVNLYNNQKEKIKQKIKDNEQGFLNDQQNSQEKILTLLQSKKGGNKCKK